jgi:hypothetical protein
MQQATDGGPDAPGASGDEHDCLCEIQSHVWVI